MKAKNILFILIGISIILSFSFLIFLFRAETQTQPLPILGQVPDFHLYDSNGQEFNSSNLQGKVWVADFIFTSCGGICLIMTKNMAQLQRSFQMMNDAHFVSFSVNPEDDSPAVLSGFAKKYNADTRNWHFLTGDQATIAAFTKSIGLVYEGVSDGMIGHNMQTLILSPAGTIHDLYQGSGWEVDKVYQALLVLSNYQGKEAS